MKKKAAPTMDICDICLVFNSIESLKDLLEEIVQKFTRYFNLKGALIRTLDRKWKTLELGAHCGLSDEYVSKGTIIIEKSPIDQELLGGKVVLIEKAADDPRVQYPENVRKEGIHSVIFLPLMTKNHVLGVLRGYTGEARKFSKEELTQMEKLARQAATAIENLTVKEREKSLQIFSRTVNSSLDLSHVLETAAKLAAEAMNVKACTIKLIDERRHRMVLRGSSGLSKSFIEKSPQGIDDLPIDQEVMKGQVIYIPYVTKDPRFVMPELAEKEGLASALCVPLKAMDRVLGTMRVYTATEYDFSNEEKSYLMTLANQAAIAVNNAILHERLHTLFLVSSSLSKSLDIHQVFTTIVETATKAMNAQGCALILCQPETSAFSLDASYGMSKEFLQILKDEYIDASSEILCGSQMIKCHLDMDFNRKCYNVAVKEGIHSFVNVPMLAKEHLTGVLQIFFAYARDFTSDEIEFVCALANEAAVAIENAKLYEALNRKYHHLVEDVFLWYDGTSRGMDY
jgi:GAF domain-containing protein